MAKGKDEKRGRKKARTKTKKEETQNVELEQFDNTFNIDGVIKLVLSTITQRAVGCVVGEDITNEDPWIYIKKEKVQDNLELHEESSEFLPIKQCISEFPEEDMLIGFDKPIEDDKQLFFFCTKLTAQNKVATILEKQKAEMQERLKRSVQKYPRKWTSFGSETEVNENIIQSLRPLIEVELYSKYPLYKEKKKFRLRLVEHATDGYVEILPGEYPITNVYRKRVDCAIQVTLPTRENEAQTNSTYPKDMWTQYNYEYKEPKLDEKKQKYLMKFLMQKAEDLNDTINVNEYINLYTNDYLRIAKQVHKPTIFVNRDVRSFRDVLACKGLIVSDVALDPFKSGVIAVSYSKSPSNKMYTLQPGEDEVNETTFGSHLVLVWCNTDQLRPKLYLHSFREVNSLRYCAQKPNILFGGCNNGQIVIWDLNGKLERVENKEILTSSEQKHRDIMHSLMGWMKHTSHDNVVFPTVISNLEYSHNAPVVALPNLLQNYQVTKNGKIEKLPEGETSLQFASCGMDGKILFWDLLTQLLDVTAAKQKKSRKADNRPLSLLKDVSEFRNLNNILMPIYKINVKDKTTHAPYPLTGIVVKNKNFSYKARNPETLGDIYTRTYFDIAGPRDPDYVVTNSLELSDKLGNFSYCHFEGHDFDQGEKVNYENIFLSGEFMTVHDGPIRICLAYSIDPRMILTIGGTVWAIWHVNYPGRPLFSRKSHVTYVGGVWSSQQLGALVLARSDSYFETWTLLQYSKGPTRLIRMTGNPIFDYYSDDTKSHVKKDTILITDTIGAVRMYYVPTVNKIVSDVSISIFIADVKRGIERREKHIAWVQAWKQRYGQEKSGAAEALAPEQQQPAEKQKPTEGEEANVEIKQEETKADDAKAEAKQEKGEHHKTKKEPATYEKKWKEKQEQLMFNILLEKNKLNLPEIEQHKIVLQNRNEDRQSKQIKVQEILVKKNEIFENAKNTVFDESSRIKKRKYNPELSPEIHDMVKERYVEHYNDILSDTMKYIETHSYRHNFDLSKMITQAKERRKCAVYAAYAQRQANNMEEP